MHWLQVSHFICIYTNETNLQIFTANIKTHAVKKKLANNTHKIMLPLLG